MTELLLIVLLGGSTAAGPQRSDAPAQPPARTAPTQTAATAAPAPKPTPLVVDARKHTILFFTAAWCPACLRMKAQTLPNVLLPGHDLRIIDFDQYPQLTKSYGVEGLPAYIVLDGLGRAYRTGVGFRDVRQFVDFLNAR
jgi:thiol:disulfide interchange protein